MMQQFTVDNVDNSQHLPIFVQNNAQKDMMANS